MNILICNFINFYLKNKSSICDIYKFIKIKCEVVLLFF